jgi:glutathione S-transferase
MLDDDGFRLTESSAILKYLADKYDLPSYPKDLKKRATQARDPCSEHKLWWRFG